MGSENKATLDRVRRTLLVAGAAFPLMRAGDAHALSGSGQEAPPTGQLSDFDFQEGRWRVRHRARSASTREWQEFEGECTMNKVLGGQGNVEDHRWSRDGQVYHAMGLRTFDPSRSQWFIFWLDSRWPTTISSPVVGGFQGDLGIFYSDEVVDGQTTRSRFLWSIQGPDACRWEQGSSTDGGGTWDTNWYMVFDRI